MEEFNSNDWVTVEVDSQLLSSFMACPSLFNYKFNLHLIPVAGVSKGILKGQLVHTGYHAYNKAVIAATDHRSAVTLALQSMRTKAPELPLEPEDLIEVYRGLEDFLEFHVNDSWRRLDTERSFKVLAYEDPTLRLRIVLTGRIDLLVDVNPTIPLAPVDLKSESESWFYSNTSGTQFKIYCIACKSNYLFVQRLGFQKTVKPEKKFKVETLFFHDDVLNEFKNVTLPYYIKQMLECMNDNYWPMNHANCVKGHFACMFSDKYNSGGICGIPPKDREAKIARFFTVGEEWSPENEV